MSETTEMTAEIVSAFVANNNVSPDDLPNLIKSVFAALSTVGQEPAEEITKVAKPSAAAIRKSIREDGLVSFEDGKTYQTLKRHLTNYGLTIAEYKQKWGLPMDYPTTSPSYSAKRSMMAKKTGLGQKGRGPGSENKVAKQKAKKSASVQN